MRASDVLDPSPLAQLFWSHVVLDYLGHAKHSQAGFIAVLFAIA